MRREIPLAIGYSWGHTLFMLMVLLLIPVVLILVPALLCLLAGLLLGLTK